MILDYTNVDWEARARKPSPDNSFLQDLFSQVTRVQIKDGGVASGKAMQNEVMLLIENAEDLRQFGQLIKIIESPEEFYCMCLGTYAIELYSNEKLLLTIGYHHGYSIRIEHWSSDAELLHPEELLQLLKRLGFSKPWEENQEAIQRSMADEAAENEWLDIAPECFSKNMDALRVSPQNAFENILPELEKEIPSSTERIIALLQTFGKSKNFWNAYYSYESICDLLLNTFPLEQIIASYTQSDRNYKTRRGLGRYIIWNIKGKRRKKKLIKIPLEVLEDLVKCFKQMKDQTGEKEINRLITELQKYN